MMSEPARDTRPAGQNTAVTADRPGSAAPSAHHVVRRTRIGGIWAASALFAVVFGVLLAVIPGTARIIQLHSVARRHQRLDAGTAASSAARPASAAAGPGQAPRTT